MSSNLDQTLVLIKPDALKNSITGYILVQLSEFHSGLHFCGMKIVHVSKMLAEAHYEEHKEKSFYPSLIEYIQGKTHYPDEPEKQRVIALIYQGPDAVAKIRSMAGPTDPHVARVEKPGCIRSLGTVVPVKYDDIDESSDRIDNLVHASATNEEAEREIKLWFKPNDVPPSMITFETIACQSHFYYKNGNILDSFEEGSFCLAAPGDIVWKSDLDALEQLYKGEKSNTPLEAIAAKYLINNCIFGC